MIYNLYSIRDVHTGFMQPVLESADAVAIRNFSIAINSGNKTMQFAPGDFALYTIGSFDSDSGVITPVDPPSLVVQGTSVLNAKE